MSVSATRRAGHVFGGNYGDDVDVSRWVVIYPPYIDSTRKVSEGRKIGKEKCVSKPNTPEIFEVTKQLGLKTVAELEKAYSRDYFVRGRVKVCLFDNDGSALKADIPNRRTLYAKVAALIPKYREKSKGTQGKGSSSGKSTGSKKKRKGKR